MKTLLPLLLATNLSLADNITITPDELVRVYDGDTITVNIPHYPAIVGHRIGIRLNGMDTPEIRGKCLKEKQLALIAKQETYSLLTTAKEIHLKNIKRGKYFRIVADVYADDTSITEHLVSLNLAYRYDGGTKQSWCEE